jgi:hypothetical protein
MRYHGLRWFSCETRWDLGCGTVDRWDLINCAKNFRGQVGNGQQNRPELVFFYQNVIEWWQLVDFGQQLSNVSLVVALQPQTR